MCRPDLILYVLLVGVGCGLLLSLVGMWYVSKITG